jgi:hypothetical protein
MFFNWIFSEIRSGAKKMTKLVIDNPLVVIVLRS